MEKKCVFAGDPVYEKLITNRFFPLQKCANDLETIMRRAYEGFTTSGQEHRDFTLNATNRQVQENVINVVGGKELLLELGFSDEGPKLKLASKDFNTFKDKVETYGRMLDAAVKTVYEERHGQEKLQSSPALRPERLRSRPSSPVTSRGNPSSPAEKALTYRLQEGQKAVSARRAQKEKEKLADQEHRAAVLADKRAKVKAIRDAKEAGKEEVRKLKEEKLEQELREKAAHKEKVADAALTVEQAEIDRKVAIRAKIEHAAQAAEDKRQEDERERRKNALQEAKRLEEIEAARQAEHKQAMSENLRISEKREQFRERRADLNAKEAEKQQKAEEEAKQRGEMVKARNEERVREDNASLKKTLSLANSTRSSLKKDADRQRMEEQARVAADNKLRTESFKATMVERKHRTSKDAKRASTISTDVGTSRSGTVSVSSPSVSMSATTYRKIPENKVADAVAERKRCTKDAIPQKPVLRGLSKGAVKQNVYVERYEANESGVRYWPFRDTVYGPLDWNRREGPWKQPYYFDQGDEERPRQYAPDRSLKLEFVYGYGGKTSQGHAAPNAFYCGNGTQEVVYFSAAVGIVFDTKAHAQRFYLEHDAEITAMALHPNRVHVATGQLSRTAVRAGTSAKVLVWDTRTMETLWAVPETFHTVGISVLSFSPGAGDRLNTVGMDTDRTLAVWDLSAGSAPSSPKAGSGAAPAGAVRVPSRITHSKLNVESLFDCVYAEDGASAVTVGTKHIKFWTFASNGLLKMERARMGTEGTMQTQLCAVAVKDDVMATGAKDGHVYLWRGSTLQGKFMAHEGGCYQITTSPLYKESLVTCGREGVVKVWSLSGGSVGSAPASPKGGTASASGGAMPTTTPIASMEREINFSAKVRASSSKRAAALCCYQNKCLVGTEGNEVVEIELDSSDGADASRVLVTAHDDHIYGLAAHPSKPLVATASDDETVRIWNTDHCKATEQCFPLANKAQCLSFSHDGDLLAIGCDTGKFFVIKTDAKSLDVVKEVQERRDPILDIKFSPKGTYLAVASHEAKIDVYEVGQNYHRHGQHALEGHTSFVTHMDWSLDEKFLRSTCGENNLLFWDMETGTQVTGQQLRDCDWATETCLLGWGVRGIWSVDSDGADVNACARSAGGQSLVTGTDSGEVRLYRYPVVDEEADHKTLPAHSSAVSNVAFSANPAGSDESNRAFSVGSLDMALCQWKHM